MAVRKRAISDSDKLKRREKILKAAGKLYEKNDGVMPTILEMAQRAGLSKGCVYLYFQSKNEIFLTLYMDQVRLWHDSVAEALESHNGQITVSDYARISTQYVVNNSLVLKMWGTVNSLFDGNTDEKVFVAFKVQLAELLHERSRLTCRLFPSLSAKQWLGVHMKIYALIFGLWQLFYSPNQVKKINQKSQVDILGSNFGESVVDSVTTFLNGALKT